MSYPKGTKFSKEHRTKISIALTGRKQSMEHKRNVSKALKGKPNPKLKGQKIGPQSEEHKRKIGLANKGKRRSEEFKENLRIVRLKQIIPFKNTSIEVKLQGLLKESNIDFETHYPLVGQPDIFIKPNICIFADGCYWHKCPECGHSGRTERDKQVNEELQKQGYIVIRLWEHEIKDMTSFPVELVKS